jgi:hypothetical protein
MPTTIPMTQDRTRAPIYASGSGTGWIVALGHRARDEFKSILKSNDFRTVAVFCAIGLLAGLIAAISGVQGVWM